MPERKRGQNREKGRSSAHKKATKQKAWRPILKWIRTTAMIIAASISAYNITILNVESWPAAQLTQETHFSFDSKTSITVGGDK